MLGFTQNGVRTPNRTGPDPRFGPVLGPVCKNLNLDGGPVRGSPWAGPAVDRV
jgi:hypothetical protein